MSATGYSNDDILYHKAVSVRRKFCQLFENLSYFYNSKLIDSYNEYLEESGPENGEIVTLKPCIEFKQFSDLTSTDHIRSLCKKALMFAAGILNRRLNGIIYFGIKDVGKIIEGCKISADEKEMDIGNIKEKIKNMFAQYLEKCFGSANTKVKLAAKNCISSPKFIKVIPNFENNGVSFNNNLFVIEVEVESKMMYLSPESNITLESEIFFEIPADPKSRKIPNLDKNENENDKNKTNIRVNSLNSCSQKKRSIFYIRDGPSTRSLNNDEFTEYLSHLPLISKNRIKEDEAKEKSINENLQSQNS